MRVDRLDGIRALAILMVFVNHTDHPWTKNWGWQGVDLFFVLSGFLITGILRRDRAQSGFWQSFYVKRATRILPPFFVCFLGSAVLTFPAWKILWSYDLFFLANLGGVLYPMLGGPLGVLWSLAVEEHFYVLWPFGIRRCSKSFLLKALVIVIVLEPLIRLLCSHLFSTAEPIYLLTPFRLDGLALGSLLAILVEEEKTRAVIFRTAGWITVSTIALYLGLSALPSFVRVANSPLFNSAGYSLIAVASAGFVGFIYLNESNWISRLLSWSPVVFIGRISYGLYLYHLMVLAALNKVLEMLHRPKSHALAALVVVPASILASWLSFRLYEMPLLRFGHRKAQKYVQTPKPSLGQV